MNNNTIINLIDKEIEKLKLMLSKKNEELEFFDRVVVENSFTSPSKLASINYKDIIVALIAANKSKLSFERIQEIFKLNRELLSITDQRELALLLKYLDYKKKKLELSELVEITTKKLFNDASLEMLSEIFDDIGFKLFEIIELINIMKEMREDYYSFTTNGYKNMKMADLKDAGYNMNNIGKYFSAIQDYFDKLRTEDKKQKKEINKSINNYEQAKKVLENKNLDIDKLLSLITNDEIKKEILINFNKDKKDEYNKVYREYLSLSKDNELQVQALFNDYNLEFNLTQKAKTKVLNMSQEELKLYLEKINKLGITDLSLIDFIFINSQLQVLDNVISLIKDEYLTYNFIIENRTLLSTDKMNNNYFKLILFFELWKVEGINPRLFINDLGIYLKDIDMVSTNINVLKSYNLFNSFKKLSKFDLLSDINLSKKIDMLLELGYEKELEDDLSILNCDINAIKRLYVLKGISLSPTDKESLDRVLFDDKFFIDDNNLDDYIFNVVNYRVDNKLIDIVDENYYTYLNNKEVLKSRTILVEGILFSTNKVKRNMEILSNSNLSDKEIYKNSILIGSVLTEEEYDLITNNLEREYHVKSI